MTTEIKGNSLLILGYGREGQSVYRFLRARFPKLRLGIADKNELSQPPLNAAIHCGDAHLEAIQDYETICRSPGIPLSNPHLKQALAAGKHFTSATNLFAHFAPGTLIGVTGTKGKSTTAALSAHLLGQFYQDVRLVGNIGVVALEQLEPKDAIAPPGENTIFVLETSSYQLEDFRYAVHSAIFLNVVAEHLDYHGDFPRYLEAKLNLVLRQNAFDALICNPKWESSKLAVSKSRAQPCYFATSPDYPHSRSTKINESSHPVCLIRDGIICTYIGETLHEISALDEIPLEGPGNMENILAACTLARRYHLPLEHIAQGLKSFTPLSNRLELVGKFRGIEFYNDSLATIPQATENALLALGSKTATLILGGHDRGLDYSVLLPVLERSSVQFLILFPSTGEKIRLLLEQAGLAERFVFAHTDSMEEAVRLAYQRTPCGKACLLSPAASSYNLFRDYAERGERFKHWVRELAGAMK